MGLRGKLAIAFSGMLALQVGTSLLGSAVLIQYARTTEQAFKSDLDSIVAVREIRNSLLAIDDDLQLWIEEGIRPDFKDAAEDIETLLLQEHERARLPDESQVIASVAAHWAELRPALDALEGDSPEGRERYAERKLEPHMRAIDRGLGTLFYANLKTIRSGHDALQDSTVFAIYAMYGLTACGAILAGAFALLSGRVLLRPLLELTASVHAVQKGDLEQKVPVHSRDELGLLARAFNNMAAQLRVFKELDQQKLLRSQHSTQLAIDSMADAVAVADGSGVIELVNETARRLFRLEAGEHVSTAADGGRLADVHRRLFEQGRSAQITGYESAVEVADGERQRYFLPQARPITDGSGRIVGATLILVDVTDYRRVDQLKDDLLSMTSHELKTPLTSLRVVLPLLLDGQVGKLSAAQRDLLDAANSDAQRLHHIVENLLDLGRTASGRLAATMQAVSPKALTDAALRTHSDAFAGAGVALSSDTTEGTPRVIADFALIGQALSNLLMNALRYTPRGGEVKISVQPAATGIVFSVSDSGCGIPGEYLSRVYERFFRVPGQRNETGTGLGLAIVKEIVQMHGGHVGVESQAGRGSVFWFTLRAAGDAGLERGETADTGPMDAASNQAPVT